ncbi:MAG: TolC family protein [Acidobacteriia bacterium]|nr:TolC family protein [Terriglobia bacterium]
MEKRNGRIRLGTKLLVLVVVVLAIPVGVGVTPAQSPLPMPGYFRDNIFTRDFVPPGKERISDLIERLTKEGKVTISEADVIAVALQNSLDIQVQRETVPPADYDVLKTYSPFDPIFTATANNDRRLSPSSNFLQSGVFGQVIPISNLSQNFNFSYLQAFQTGTNARIDYDNSKAFISSRLASLNPSITSALRLSFTQALLKNRGVGVNSVPIKIAKNNRDITKEQFSLTVINIMNQALNLYWEVVFAREDIRVRQASLDLAIKTNEDNKRQVEIGTLAPIDVVQSETSVAARRLEVTTAQYTLQQTEDTLKRFLSPTRDPGAVIAKLEPVDRPKPPTAEETPKVSEAITEAINNRPELTQARLDLQNRDLRLQFTKNQLLPQIDVNGGYQWIGLAGNSPVLDSQGNPVVGPDGKNIIVTAGYPETTRQLFSFQFPEYFFGVSLALPIRNKSAQADFGRASYEKRQSDANLRLSEQQVALQVRNAITTVEMNKARIQEAKRTRELQEKTLDAENKKYQLGASTIRFVLQEQTNLAVVQDVEIRAEVDYAKSKIALAQAEGLLLRNYGVQIEDVLGGNEQTPKKPTADLRAVTATTGNNR